MLELLEPRGDLEKVAVIFNPACGTLDPQLRRSHLEGLAHAAGLSCPLGETDAELGAEPLAQKAVADGMERVLVSGGDGTVKEAAEALVGTGVDLAVLPAGTGNLLAVNVGIPNDTEAAMRLALSGEALPTDVGRANGQVFLIMAGIGADARMIRDADRNLKRRLGPLAYFAAALRNLGRPRTLFTITVDGRQVRRHAQTVLVANLGRITGGIELIPGADPADGLLQVAVLRARTLREMGELAWGALLGRVRSDDRLEIYSGRDVLIESDTPQPVELDGNDVGTTSRLQVTVEPGALRLIRPSEFERSPVALPAVAGDVLSRPWRAAAVLGALGVAAAAGYLVWRRGRKPR